MVVPNTVEALSQLFLREPSPGEFRGKGLYRLFLALDIALDVPPRTSFRDNLLRCDGNEIVSEDIRGFVFLQGIVDGIDRVYTGEAEQVSHFR